MGVALLENGKLVYHAVKVVNKGRSPHQTLKRAKGVILRLIDDLAPQVIAVEKTFFSKNRNAALLNVLFDEIRSVARRKRLKFVSYAPSTIKKFTCGNGRSNKREVARVRTDLLEDAIWEDVCPLCRPCWPTSICTTCWISGSNRRSSRACTAEHGWYATRMIL